VQIQNLLVLLAMVLRLLKMQANRQPISQRPVRPRKKQLASQVPPNLVEVPLQRNNNQHASVPPPSRESKMGALGLSSDRSDAAGGSGGEGLSDEEGSNEEEDDEDIMNIKQWCILLSSANARQQYSILGYILVKVGTGQVRGPLQD
jgi:hypothetical protein